MPLSAGSIAAAAVSAMPSDITWLRLRSSSLSLPDGVPIASTCSVAPLRFSASRTLA